MGTILCQRVTELSLKPNYATYEPGERAVLTLQGQILQRAGDRRTSSELWTFDLTVEREDRTSGTAERVWSHRLQMELSGEQQFVRLPLPVSVESGLYRVVCRAQGPDGEVRNMRQGFWGQDDALLAEGEVITRSRDYFVKEGRPLPVVGMTYMTSDVAENFCFCRMPTYGIGTWHRWRKRALTGFGPESGRHIAT